MAFSETIDTTCIASFTTSSCTTVKNSLHTQSNFGEAIIPHDVNTISKCRRRSLSPAASTVNRYMLILRPGKIVHTLDVLPSEVVRDIVRGQELVRQQCSYKVRDVFFWLEVTSFPFVSFLLKGDISEEFFCLLGVFVFWLCLL